MPAESGRPEGQRRILHPGVERVVGQKNVGESYEHIARSAAHRINRYASPEQKAEPSFRQDRSKIITDAVIAHRRNRDVYTQVMGYQPEYALQGPALMRHFAREALRQEKLSNEGED